MVHRLARNQVSGEMTITHVSFLPPGKKTCPSQLAVNFHPTILYFFMNAWVKLTCLYSLEKWAKDINKRLQLQVGIVNNALGNSIIAFHHRIAKCVIYKPESRESWKKKSKCPATAVFFEWYTIFYYFTSVLITIILIGLFVNALSDLLRRSPDQYNVPTTSGDRKITLLLVKVKH